MPIYEYRCEACGAEFEQLLFTAAEQAAVRCKTCDSDQVAKLLSGAAVHLGASSALPCGSSGCDLTPSGRPPMGGCCGGGCSH
jgi:putative FmdB family regulatory protein